MSHRERLRTTELPEHLRDNLLPRAQEWIDKTFTSQQQHQIETGLNGVIRMSGLRKKGFPIPQDFQQTNLVHEINMLREARELASTKPELSKHIDFSEVQIYVYGHDVPEMLDKVGDVQPTNRTRRDEARKRLEHMAAKNFLIPQIMDPEMRADALRRYKEYEAAHPDNLEVQMAKYLDQKDGTITYAHIAFNRHAVDNPDILVRMKLHLYETLPKLIAPAVNLLVGLPTQAARMEMRDMLVTDLSAFEKYAPRGVATPYKERFAA